MVIISACTSSTVGGGQPADGAAAATAVTESSAVESTTTTRPTTTSASTTTIPETTTTVPETTTTTTVADSLDVFDPDCVVEVGAGETLERIAAQDGVSADTFGLWAENDFVDVVSEEDLVDVCVDNRINDISGDARIGLDDPSVEVAMAANVERQQTKLNELFAGYNTGDLAVDGVSGPITGQRLCGVRLTLGLPTSTADMVPGSDEQNALMSADALPTPASTATESERWVLIDRTCQMMFIGAGSDTIFAFQTSTGSEGFETRDQDRASAFRFNPALDNGGWHNSSDYPVGVDNPLNGNLYKPLYFDLGQAIHGANYVPPTPQSKGCARLQVSNQELLLSWLGLDTLPGETWQKSTLNVTVNVQGEFQPR